MEAIGRCSLLLLTLCLLQGASNFANAQATTEPPPPPPSIDVDTEVEPPDGSVVELRLQLNENYTRDEVTFVNFTIVSLINTYCALPDVNCSVLDDSPSSEDDSANYTVVVIYYRESNDIITLRFFVLTQNGTFNPTDYVQNFFPAMIANFPEILSVELYEPPPPPTTPEPPCTPVEADNEAADPPAGSVIQLTIMLNDYTDDCDNLTILVGQLINTTLPYLITELCTPPTTTEAATTEDTSGSGSELSTPTTAVEEICPVISESNIMSEANLTILVVDYNDEEEDEVILQFIVATQDGVLTASSFIGDLSEMLINDTMFIGSVIALEPATTPPPTTPTPETTTDGAGEKDSGSNVGLIVGVVVGVVVLILIVVVVVIIIIIIFVIVGNTSKKATVTPMKTKSSDHTTSHGKTVPMNNLPKSDV